MSRSARAPARSWTPARTAPAIWRRTSSARRSTSTLGDIRITVRESSPDIDEDLYLIKNGSARFAEDNSTVPGNDPDALRSIPNGMVFAEVGNVRLQVGDDVFTHQNSRILANGTIDIFGDWSNADTGGTPD